MRILTEFNARYALAKIRGKVKHGFALDITGDIDKPAEIDFNVLEEWIKLASEKSGRQPILYVLANPIDAFLKIKDYVDGKAVFGVHGIEHVHQYELSNDEMEKQYSALSVYSNRFRAPYLGGATNLRMLRAVAKHFKFDSSSTSSKAHKQPFAPFPLIPDFYEYPVMLSDTVLRKVHTPEEGYRIVQKTINSCKSRNHHCTLLLHPNQFVMDMFQHWN